MLDLATLNITRVVNSIFIKEPAPLATRIKKLIEGSDYSDDVTCNIFYSCTPALLVIEPNEKAKEANWESNTIRMLLRLLAKEIKTINLNDYAN